MNDYFNSFEAFEKNIGDKALLLQYKILFRRWDLIGKIEESERELAVKQPVKKSDFIEWRETDYKIKHIIEWNAGYYNRNREAHVTEKNEIAYYTDSCMGDKSVFEVFFPEQQPLLNVTYYKAQTRASAILRDRDKINLHLLFDEVGTGKTVSALYCVRDIIEQKKENSKILVICPNNKKSEWQKDIKRQLGLYAHIADYGNESGIYENNMKQFYFKKREPAIFIEGQKTGEMNDDLNQWASSPKPVKWDLIVIDEGHQCFDNYKTMKAEKALLLTATPIVINSSLQDGVLDISRIRRIDDYIGLMCGIVGEERKYSLNHLFEESDIFTQLFREDLGIEPKKRRICFEKCGRLENRDDYLDALAEVKGGMTRLIYEQDDEFLLYGIYEKFKENIEEAGYIIEKRPDIKNKKYEKLLEYINRDGTKSYIVFFNTIWPSDNVYKKLIKAPELDKGNTVIAKKYGGKICGVWPQDATVTSQNMYDYLQGKIEEGKRVLFLTTGATGGTGLNLGKFKGVINYELPFTSIELEQRFGRIDRMDATGNSEKEMVFMINNDENPMLRYSSIKINETCNYMPIRNTVLFNSDFINTNIDSLKREYEACKLTGDESDILIKFHSFIEQTGEMELLKGLIDYIRKKGTTDGFLEDMEGMPEALLEFIRVNAKTIRKFYQLERKINGLAEEAEHWSNLLGNSSDEISIESGSVSVVDEEDDCEEYRQEQGHIKSKEIIMINTKKNKQSSALYNLGKLTETIKRVGQKIDSMDNAVESQMATGIFFVKDGKYYRSLVKDYRKLWTREGTDGK